MRVGNNDYDPLSQISVFKVSKGQKNRRGEFGKVTKFDGKFNPSTIPNTILFEGKKFGEHSGHLHNHVGLTENFDQSENEEFLVNDSP